MSSISSSTTSNALKITGLASGVDTDKMVEGLLATYTNQVTTLTTRQDKFTLLQTTHQALQASVLDLQSQAARLARSSGGPFDGRKVVSSDETVVKAAAGSSAVAGTYSFKVKSLATAHQVASAGVADSTSLLKTGTLQLKVGEGNTTTVTVDSSNNTLQGLVSAINSSGAEVTASLVNDGTTGGTAYRLMLTSKKTGAVNDIEITNNLTGGTGAALNLDPATQSVQAGADAEVVLGSGAALTVKSATNKLDSLIGGVTLDLQSANVDKAVTLTVSNDTTSARSAIEGLVSSYNNVVDFIDERDDYNSTSKAVGTLLGSSITADLQNQMARTIGGVVAGVNGLANRLSALGVTLNDKGRLSIDSGKLDLALSGQASGVSMTDVRKMFAVEGSSTNANVSFVLGGAKTQATSSPIGVNVTQVAKQASVTADAAIAAPVTIGAANKTVAITLFGRNTTLTLAEGTYTADALAKELQGKINANSDLGGNQVAVGVESGKLKISTTTYGSAAKVTFSGGTALADLGITAGQTGSGQDVAGFYKVNGKEEYATGSGQILLGRSGNATTEGLQVKVTLSEAQLNADPAVAEADMSITVGLGGQLDRAMRNFTDSVNGRFTQIDKGYTADIEETKTTITRQNVLIEAKREALVIKFAGMEAAISKLKSMGDSMTSMLLSSSSN